MNTNPKEKSKSTLRGLTRDVLRFLDNNPMEIIVLDFKSFTSIGSMFSYK